MVSSDKKNKASKVKMANQSHQIKVAKGFNGIDTERFPSIPSENSHQEGILRSVESQVFLAVCPPKESFSDFHQRRQKSEMKRLYRHTHPELKALNNVIDKELEEELNSEHAHTATSNRYQGEVQSMRWMFENWTIDDSHHRGPHTTTQLQEEKISEGEDVKGNTSMFEHRKSGTHQFTATAGLLNDCTRGDIHKATLISEKQPLDAIKRPDQDDAGMEAEKWNELIQGGDVKGMSLLLKSTALDPMDCTSSVEDHSFTKPRSEIQEQRTDEVKTLNLFKAEPCCELCDSSGNTHKTKPMCKEQFLNRRVRTQYWTSPDKGVVGVQICQGIYVEEDWKDGIDRDRQGWMTQGQALDTAFMEELSNTEHTVSKNDIVGADVRSILWSFDPEENHKNSNKMRCREKVTVSGHEREPVMKRKHVCEPAILDCGNKEGKSDRNACRIEHNDVKSYKNLFEISPQRNLAYNKHHDNRCGNEKYNKALFETTAIKDCSSSLDQLNDGKILHLEVKKGRKIHYLNRASKEASYSTESQCKQSSTFYSENEKIARTHETDLDDPVVDEQRSDLQAAIQRLRQATDEARSIEYAVQERQQASAEKVQDQAVYLSTVDDVVRRSEQEKESDVVGRGNVTATINVLQGSTIQQPFDKEEIEKGHFQAALRSLEKSSINISKGGFKAAMLYRQAGKSYSAQKKKQALQTVCKQAIVEPLPPSQTELPHSVLLVTDKLSAVKRVAEVEVVEDHSTDKTTDNKPSSSALSNQSQNTLPFHPRHANQKPAIPPKPDYLKKICGPATRSVPVHKNPQ
ncbi:xin actin-binding repeat-containing protein 1-like [Conger conger]|uniref:xin actin-binding repeat-containing protein 1-like n=1 Tax=Conger conger TaxID=82655 RepID=UPI002A5A7BC9|nr:xin actin-binding repeat-containing protein 1-like [Conger conger]